VVRYGAGLPIEAMKRRRCGGRGRAMGVWVGVDPRLVGVSDALGGCDGGVGVDGVEVCCCEAVMQ
jgi:hypothetical protein